jgi:hypothetical protein
MYLQDHFPGDVVDIGEVGVRFVQINSGCHCGGMRGEQRTMRPRSRPGQGKGRFRQAQACPVNIACPSE